MLNMYEEELIMQKSINSGELYYFSKVSGLLLAYDRAHRQCITLLCGVNCTILRLNHHFEHWTKSTYA